MKNTTNEFTCGGGRASKGLTGTSNISKCDEEVKKPTNRKKFLEQEEDKQTFERIASSPTPAKSPKPRARDEKKIRTLLDPKWNAKRIT